MIDWVQQKPGIWHAKIGTLTVSVHKYFGCGDDLFLSCNDLRIDTFELGTSNTSQAFMLAIEHVRSVLEAMYSAFMEALN